ncbi:MAG: hypothetical protein LBK82_14020 [Planctomycetaceae bacterium]|jgi:hypothetical protein|nr:hypothetical protein [Planctomycetaceae bacterium]
MKTISELAYEAIIESELFPEENVAINNVIHSDWNGSLRVLISEGDGDVDTETQFGAIAQTTVLTIAVLSNSREEAVMAGKQVSEIAFQHIEKLERKQGYGILAITKFQNGIKNVTDRDEFEAYRSFNVLNSINL